MIVGVIGYIGSGKGATAEYLMKTHGFKQESFAKTVKDAAAVIFSWPRHLLEGDTEESRTWREQKDEYWTAQLGWDVTPRAVLQKLGTEAGREIFGVNLWTASLIRRIHLNSQYSYVISDVRFPNEVESLRAAGGRLVHVLRGQEPDWAIHLRYIYNTMPIDVDEWMEHFYPDVHASEYNIALLQAHADHEIQNDGSLEQLHQRIQNTLKL